MAEVLYADLEIGLSSLGGTRYRVEVRYWPLDDAAREPPGTGEARLDPKEFIGKSPEDYGKLLAERLFEDQAVREAFIKAQVATYARDLNPTGLRVRLWFDPGTERLYDLRWETLCDPPQPGGAVNPQVVLSTHDLIPFSRFLASWNNRRVQLRPKSELRPLVLIATPPVQETLDNDMQALAVVDVHAEWERAKIALQGLPAPRLLAKHADANGPPTRKNLLDELATGYDIVYIVCHGVLDGDEPYFQLETDEGQPDDVPGYVLEQALSMQPQPPRLVVLTACQSAGTGRSTENTAHLALGPGFVRAGVPAVLAMHGKVSMETAVEFYPRFFAALLQHGAVDRAMATTRRTVKNLGRHDWWMPVLYMRLSAGRIWSVLRVVQREESPLEELSLSLQNETCTPILGPGLLEPLWGSPRLVARRWAEERGFPLAPHCREDLPSVAQYLARRRQGNRDRRFVVQHWMRTIEGMLIEKWPELNNDRDRLQADPPAERLRQLATAAGVRLRNNPYDPYRLLALLPVKVYLTATPDPLLVDALRAVGREPEVQILQREPVVEYARWTEPLLRKPRAFDEKKMVISRQHPLVFHLFGTLSDPDSLVITEDDFFDYLIRVVQDYAGTAIPNEVRAAWSANSLLFLGFDLDDWAFRVLYRAILSEPGHMTTTTMSAAVQLSPEEDRNLRPEMALQYLEQAFGSEHISVYWTEPQDFLRDVWKYLPKPFGGAP